VQGTARPRSPGRAPRGKPGEQGQSAARQPGLREPCEERPCEPPGGQGGRGSGPPAGIERRDPGGAGAATPERIPAPQPVELLWKLQPTGSPRRGRLLARPAARGGEPRQGEVCPEGPRRAGSPPWSGVGGGRQEQRRGAAVERTLPQPRAAQEAEGSGGGREPEPGKQRGEGKVFQFLSLFLTAPLFL